MSTLLLQNEPNVVYVDNSESITQTINLTDTTLSVKTESTYDELVTGTLSEGLEPPPKEYQKKTVTVSDWNLPFSVIQEVTRLKSNTLVGIRLTPKFQRDGSSGTLTAFDLVNLSLLTYNERLINSFSSKLSHLCEVQILVKNPNTNFTDCKIIIAKTNDYTLNTTASTEQLTQDKIDIISLLDDITVSKDLSYSDADYFKYNVSTESYVDELCVEAVVGITDKTRISLVNGAGSFRVLKSSVDGTSAEVKVGFINYPRLVDFVDA